MGIFGAAFFFCLSYLYIHGRNNTDNNKNNRQINFYKKKLREYEEAGEYEECARLRDKIKELENQQ